MKNSVLFPIVVILPLLLLSPQVFAQTSLGFSDPGDLNALLDYRLLDWGYRTGKLNFDLTGSGFNGVWSENSQAVWQQALNMSWNRESEERISRISVSQRNDWNWGESRNKN